MKLADLMNTMETVAPAALAQDWDNVGLLFGDPDAEVTAAVVSLDITDDAIAFAKRVGAQVIVSHHPLIFSPVKAVCAPSTLFTLCGSGVAAFAAHTNLDAAKGGVNDVLAEVIGLDDVREAFDGLGRIGTLPEALTPDAFAALVKERLHTAVQVRKGTKVVCTVALVGGAGGDFAAEAEADAYLTGEIKHHEWIGLPKALTVVAAGHYATENVVVAPLAARLRQACPELTVHVFEGTAPYETV